jgi:hypothetical protein
MINETLAGELKSGVHALAIHAAAPVRSIVIFRFPANKNSTLLRRRLNTALNSPLPLPPATEQPGRVDPD